MSEEQLTGSIQPYTGAYAQENFGQMVDHVISVVPKTPIQLVKRRLNLHLRQVQDVHLWAGLMVRGEIRCPGEYNTGTIAATPDSATITGTATAWPHNDKVNTTLSAAVTVVNELQDCTPASMTNIEAGDYLLVDAGLVTEEYLLVHSITSTTFQCKPTLTHLAGATVTKSSFAGLAIRVGYNKGMYTIIGISSTQQLRLDHTWSYAAETAATYQILKAYVTMPAGFRMVWSAANVKQGWPVKPHIPQEVVQRYDSWRAAQGWVMTMLDFMPDQIGRQRYELYPTPKYAQGIPFLASRLAPPMTEEEDCPPACIPSHMLVNHTIADMLVINRASEFYDPTGSREFRRQAQEAMIYALNMDDNLRMECFSWISSRYGSAVSPGLDFWQSQDEVLFSGGV